MEILEDEMIRRIGPPHVTYLTLWKEHQMVQFSRAGILPALCLAGMFGVFGCKTHETTTMRSTPVGQDGPTDLSPKSPKPTPETNAIGGVNTMTPDGSVVGGTGNTASPPTRTMSGTNGTMNNSMPMTSGGPNRAVFAYPSGDPATSVGVLEKTMPSQVVVGQPFDIVYTLTNKSPSLALEDVVVTDTLPSGFKVNSTTPTAAGTDGGAVKWNVGHVDPGASTTLRLNGQATAPGNIQSCIAMTATPRACSSIAVVSPALKLAKTMTPAATTCEPIAATYTVTNSGTGATTNVVINDPLPDGMTTSDGKDSLSIPVGTLAPGQSRAFSANLKVNRTGKFDNTATATADNGLKSDATASTTVTAPVIQVACTGTARSFIGRQFTHEFTITNTGDAPCKNTTVTVTTPAGATVASSTGGTASAGRVSFTVPEVAMKGSSKVSVTYTAAAEGTFASNVSVACACAQTATCTTSTVVTGIPALLLDGVDDPDPVQIGSNVTYTLTVTNQGSAPLTNVKLVCTGEAATQQIVSTTGGQATVNGVSVTFAPIPTLAPKAKQTYTVVVKAIKAGQVQFKAESSSDQITRPLSKVETTNFYE